MSRKVSLSLFNKYYISKLNLKRRKKTQNTISSGVNNKTKGPSIPKENGVYKLLK